MPKRIQPGALSTAQLMAMPALPSTEKEGWSLRYDQGIVRIWLNVLTGDCCMDTKDEKGRWTRKTEWFGGVPDPETKDSK